jgi:tRNA-2-methylthio-N6-dimethylallyladenosine synthase
MTGMVDNELGNTKKSVHIETWGCQMNTADSEKMLSLLAERNYSLVGSAEEADLVLLNTCHIREKATHKVLSRLGVLRDIKATRPGMKIAVAGCVAQAEGKRLVKSAPQIDVLLGPGKIDDLPNLLNENILTGKTAMAVGFKPERNHHHRDDASPTSTLDETNIAPAEEIPFAVTQSITGKHEVSRYVNIQQGCNNYCTFCVVPFTRGREISRTPDQIFHDTKALVYHGAREVTLLGQNVNSYGLDLVDSGALPVTAGGPFVDLLARVATIDGLERLRFTTSNPHDFTPQLADLYRTEPKLGRYIHLPVQSGNDEVLGRMKRKVTRAEFMERIAWLRKAVPDMAFSTDLIVGFPGETEDQFEDTLQLIRDVRFSFIFSFKYSTRRNTVAARFQDHVPEDVKEKRLSRLMALQERITVEENLGEIGRTRNVLFVYESKKEPGIFYGRTEHFRLVRVRAERDISGQLLPVVITDGNKISLTGTLAH